MEDYKKYKEEVIQMALDTVEQCKNNKDWLNPFREDSIFILKDFDDSKFLVKEKIIDHINKVRLTKYDMFKYYMKKNRNRNNSIANVHSIYTRLLDDEYSFSEIRIKELCEILNIKLIIDTRRLTKERSDKTIKSKIINIPEYVGDVGDIKKALREIINSMELRIIDFKHLLLKDEIVEDITFAYSVINTMHDNNTITDKTISRICFALGLDIHVEALK